MKVAIIKRGLVDRIVELSTVTHPTISNFNKQSLSKLITHGIYPIVEDTVEYDKRYQRVESSHVIEPGKVRINKTVVDINIDILKMKYTAEISKKITTLLSFGHTTTSGIKMDSTITSVQTVESGYKLAERGGALSMTIRDYTNTSHDAVLMADVDQMIVELAGYVSSVLSSKWEYQDTVTSATTSFDVMTAGTAALLDIQTKIDSVV